MCVQKLDRVRETKFYDDVCILSIVTKSEKAIAVYARNQDLVKALLEERKYESEFLYILVG